MLSIVILVCDKDFHFLDKMVKDIESKVRIPYELIILDNREKKESVIDFENVKVFSQEKNIGQYEGRLWITQFCSGDYVWFVDVDDEVTEIKESFEEYKKGDLVHFNTKKRTNLQLRRHESTDKKKMLLKNDKYKTLVLEDYVDNVLWNMCKNALWSFWIKTDIMKKACNILPRNKNYKHGEDFFTLSVLFSLSKEITLVQEFIYIYNINNSCYQNPSVKGLKYLLENFSDLKSNAKKILGNKYLSYLEPYQDVWFGLSYINDFESDDDYKEAALLLYEYFGEVLFYVIKERINGVEIETKTIDRLKKAFNKDLKNYSMIWSEKVNEIKDLLDKDFEITEYKNDLEPFVSIVVLMTDRDCDYITTLLKNMYKRVHVPKEIIVVDNRVNLREKNVDFLDAKVITKGRNLFQFESKRYASEFCNGKFIWFFDSDDDLLPVDIDMDKIINYELICFDFVDQHGPTVFAEPTKRNRIDDNFNGLYTERFVSKTTSQTIKNLNGVFTWNKWYKTEIFKEITKRLPCDKEIVLAEDDFWTTKFLENCERVLFYEKPIYIHKTNVGLTSNTEFNLHSFFVFTKGYEDLFSLCNEQLMKEDCLAVRLNACRFLVKKAMDIKNFEDMKKAYFKIREMYTNEEVNQSVMYDYCYWELTYWAVSMYNLFDIELKQKGLL